MEKYDDLIRKIKRKKRIIITLTVIAELIVLLLGSPMELVLMGETMVNYKGIDFPIMLIIMFAILFFGVVATAFVHSPMTMSMENECDPEKHLALNKEFNNNKNNEVLFAIDYFYLGDFFNARAYADNMTRKKDKTVVISGLYTRARCEFFMGEYDAFKQTAEQYKKFLPSVNVNPKKAIALEEMTMVLNFLLALVLDDKEKIKEYKTIEQKTKSFSTKGFINYLKGLGAEVCGDKQEAIYRFKFVEEYYPKTFFSKLATEKLTKF